MAQQPTSASSEPGLIGTGLGPLDETFLTREAWPLRGAEALVQYHKFVQLMINRIRAGESDNEETERFINMFGTPGHWTWMVPALGMLPELEDDGPFSLNDQMNKLLQHVRKIISSKYEQRLQRTQKEQSGQAKPSVSAEAVSVEVRASLAKLLFGPDGESNASSAMKRLLTSWVDLGYPREVIQQAIDNQKESGKSVSRDNLGLPANLTEEHLFHLHMQEAQKKPAPRFIGSSRRSPASAKKVTPGQHVPDEDVSTDEEWEHMAKTLRKQFPPTAANSSPEFTDSPPESLITEFEERTNVDSGAIADAKPKPLKEKPSFWHFQRTHAHDYDKYIAPLTEADQPIPRKRPSRPITLVSTKRTKAGVLVMNGFEKQPSTASHATLKEIEETAKNQSIIYFTDSSKEKAEISASGTSSSEEARRKNRAARKEQMARLDKLSDSEPIAGYAATAPAAQRGASSSAPQPSAAAPPAKVPSQPSNGATTSSEFRDQPTTGRLPQTALTSADENKRIDEVRKHLERLGMNVKEVTYAEPPQPLDPQLLEPSDKGERVSWASENKEVEVSDTEPEVMRKPKDGTQYNGEWERGQGKGKAKMHDLEQEVIKRTADRRFNGK
ncbi:MAG: hypothetical protein LQ338_002925 [Usnochroma carphineum]|nr:MAG: hypothetical protein LQ338_002925 [Usnochroma carphineum]